MGKGQNMDWGLSRAVEADSFDQSAPDYVTQWAEKLGRRQIQLIRPTTTVGRKQLMDGRPAQRFRWSRWAQKLGMSLTLLAFIPFLLSILTVNFFPALSSLIFFLHYSCFSLSACYFAPSSFLFSHPLPNMKPLFPPCLHLPFDQLCPSYFSFFFSGPWNGEAFSIIQ